MANTPEVDDWIQKTLQLTAAAVALAPNMVDEDTAGMMRQCMSMCDAFTAALRRLRLPPTFTPGATGPMP